MNLENLSYLATVFVFPGLALVLYLVVKAAYPPDKSNLYIDDWRVIGRIALISGVLAGPAEWVALTWQAWGYNSQKTLHLKLLGAEAETFLFTILVSLVITIATLIYSRHEDRHRKNN